MKHWISRLGSGLLAVLMLVGLCACNGDTTVTTTTVGGDATTTLGDDVTTTLADDVTTTVGDDVTTTVGDDDPTTTVGDDDPTTTVKDEDPTTTKKDNTTTASKVTTTKTKVTTTKNRPWEGATMPGKTAQATTTTGEKVYATLPNIERDPKFDNPYGVYHTLLAYTKPDSGAYSKSQFLPSVGYIKDGEIQGVMYDSIIILPSPNFLYYNSASTTKANWDSWRRHTYKNMDNLNKAAKEVQEALNLKEYKVKVFPSIWMPSSDRNANWGSINGTSYAARNDEEKMTMVEYMVDGYINEIKEKNYSNLEFVGFYWFDESLDTNKGQWYIEMNQMVKSKGLYVVHAPYYKSNGYDYATTTYGFALNAMQSNYFHEKDIGQATTGSIKRLAYNQQVLLSGVTSGITVECSEADNHDCVTQLKWTLWTVLEHGTESAYHMYYFGTGANAIYDLSRSDDPYFRSAYDELYKFFNHTLTKDTINIEPFHKEQGIVSPDFKEYL